MKNQHEFESRKEQIEKEFLRNLSAELKEAGHTLSRKQRTVIKRWLRDAAMVGAAEERSRALELTRRYGATMAETAITVVPVLKVLGYED